MRQPSSQMTKPAATFLGIFLSVSAAFAQSPPALAQALSPFAGEWELDVRTPVQRKDGVDCGKALLSLSQEGEVIEGRYWYATPGCGRLTEESEVKGVATNRTAVLVIASSRNGALVMGKAQLNPDQSLRWRPVQAVTRGEPDGDDGIVGDTIFRKLIPKRANAEKSGS